MEQRTRGFTLALSDLSSLDGLQPKSSLSQLLVLSNMRSNLGETQILSWPFEYGGQGMQIVKGSMAPRLSTDEGTGQMV